MITATKKNSFYLKIYLDLQYCSIMSYRKLFAVIPKWVFRKISVRYPIVLLLFFANLYMISFRLCMSVALVAMTSKPSKDHLSLNDTSDHCPIKASDNSTDGEEPVPMKKEFHWDNYQQGVILSSYFYGFLATQILGGILCQKWSARHTMTISITLSGILTVLTPFIARHGGYQVFVASRVLLGLFSGCILSVGYLFIGNWIPIQARSFAASITYSGTNFGAILTIGISGFLSNLEENEGGWPYIFYFIGGISLLLVPFWLLTAFNHPEEHPFISESELEYLTREIPTTHGVQHDIPWKKISLSVPFYAMAIANFGHNWILDFLQLQIPTYMAQALNYDIASNALLSALPFVLKTISNFVSGALADLFYRKFGWSTNFLRKFFNTLSFYGSAIFIFCVTLSGCNGLLNVVLLCLATLFAGMCSAGFICTYVDLCRELAGLMLGLSNTIGNIAGLIAPHLIGYLTNEGSSLSQWRTVFYLTSGVFVITGTIFLVFGSSKDQEYMKKEKPSE